MSKKTNKTIMEYYRIGVPYQSNVNIIKKPRCNGPTLPPNIYEETISVFYEKKIVQIFTIFF